MLRTSKVLILIITAVFVFVSAADAFVFVSMADSRGGDNGVNSEILSQIVEQVLKENPALVIFQGDMINGSGDDEIVKAQYKKWQEVMKPLLSKVPVYVVAGNHELIGRKQEALFQDAFDMPMNGPEDFKELCYSFDYENCRFIGFDTNDFKRRYRKTSKWLKDQMDDAGDKHIFVMGHAPAFPAGPHVGSSLDGSSQNREKFWNDLVKYKVKAYFCGHEHLYNRRCVDGVYQIINGTCGAPIYGGHGGNFYHYAVIKVEGNKIEAIVKNEKGVEKDRFVISE